MRIARIVLVVALLSMVAVAAGVPEYKVLQTYKLGGEGGWDYLIVDGGSRNVFISRGTHVMVVNGDTGQPTGDIPDTPGVHGIALANDLNKGFVSNGRGNSVTVFDLKTLKTTNTIKLTDAENPDAILYDPASKRVFTFNGRSKNATAIDASNDTVISNIPLDGKPEFAVSDGRGMVYVNIEDKNEQTQIDARNAKVVKSWALTGCEEPSGLAMDQKGRRLFAGCGNKVMAITNADTGAVVATVPIGPGVDANGYDAERHLAFASNGGDGTLTIVKQDGDKYSVAQNVPTARFARTMALDPKSHNLYLVTAEIEEQPPAEGQTRPRRSMKPGTFQMMVVGSK
jgi:DNA-binding beta-propeller fold protein YncE